MDRDLYSKIISKIREIAEKINAISGDSSELAENLGSPSSASGVTGNDAFSKIATLGTDLGSPSSASGVTGNDAFSKIATVGTDLGSPSSASGITGNDAFSKIATVDSKIMTPPTSIEFTAQDAIPAFYMTSIGFYIEIALPAVPTSITGSNIEYYDGSWKSATLSSFDMHGNTCSIKITADDTNPSQGVYGLRGEFTLSYS